MVIPNNFPLLDFYVPKLFKQEKCKLNFEKFFLLFLLTKI